MALENYHGAVITGSALNIYSREAAVERQIDLAKAVFAAGVPCFGSCWGLQVGVTAAGGSVVRNPRGREFGFGRRITLTSQGRDHAMFHGKPEVFEAATVHVDTVEALPAGATRAGAQRHGPAGRRDQTARRRTFWGVQYHPEYSCAEIAAMARRYGEVLIRDGLVKDQAELDALAADLVALNDNPDDARLAWRFGVGPSITDPGIKLAELRNWLDKQVPEVGHCSFPAATILGCDGSRSPQLVKAGDILRILIVTDAWEPQVNGVVRTLKTTARELTAMGHEVRFLTPLEFRTLPCPTYPEIRLSLFPQGGVEPRNPRVRSRRAAHRHRRSARHGGAALRAAQRFPVHHGLSHALPGIRARALPPAAVAGVMPGCGTSTAPSKGVMAPTQVVVDDLEANGFNNVRLWSRGVDTDIFHPQPSKRLDSKPPIFLYVGRVAVEKNVEAFLELDLPGSKWVVGTGPALERIRARFPRVNYLGLLDREELAKVYAAADVFVFPSKTDTFGLVLLEAMACGLPVAAYPVTGPRDVIGDSKAGVLARGPAHRVPRCARSSSARTRVARAGLFTWRAATEQFLGHLHPRKRASAVPAYA